MIHAACMIDVRGCPTIGCNEADPLQPDPEPPTPRARNAAYLDLVSIIQERLGGDAQDTFTEDEIAGLQWKIEKAKNKERLTASQRGAKRAADAANRTAKKIATAGKDAAKLIALAKATRMVPSCLHQFSKMNNKCDHCEIDLFDFAEKEFGSGWTGPSTVAEGERRHQFAKDVKEAKKAREKRMQKHWIDRVFGFLDGGVKIISWILAAIIFAIVIMGEFSGFFVQ